MPILIKKTKTKKHRFTLKHKLLIVAPIIIIAFVTKYSSLKEKYLIEKKGRPAIGTVTVVGTLGVKNEFGIENVLYSFKANNKTYNGYAIATNNNNYVFTSLGMPITLGDKFQVIYVSDNPSVNIIKFDKPAKYTIEKHIKYAAYILRNMDFVKSCENPYNYSYCIAEKVYNEYKLDGLADIIFHNESLFENFTNNYWTFKRMKKSEKFKYIIESCE